MEVINKRIIHKSFGPGVIISKDDAVIEILFDNSPTGELKRFAYPFCFERFISFEDEQSQREIQEQLHSHKLHEQEQAKKDSDDFRSMRAQRNQIFNNPGKQKREYKQKPVTSSTAENINELSLSGNTNKLSATPAEYERFEAHADWEVSREEAELMRQRFVKDYPIEKIRDMTLQEYLISREGEGNSRSFCRRIRYELRYLSSMGNVRFNIFGVYHNPNGNVALSQTYEKLFGKDINSAFEYIKKAIIILLHAADAEDYRTIVSEKLNSSFKYKLITVYYPDLYIPVVTNNILNEYCNHVGLAINPNEPMIYRNIALRDWKRNNPELSDWSNSKLMGFCDWLWRSNRYYSKRR